MTSREDLQSVEEARQSAEEDQFAKREAVEEIEEQQKSMDANRYSTARDD